MGRFLQKRCREKGFSLVETLIATAIISLVAVFFLGGVGTVIKTDSLTSVRATAETVARNQLETVKSNDYINYAELGHGEYDVIAAPAGYMVTLGVTPINPDTGQSLNPGEDQGLQKVTVTVNHDENTVVTMDDYKVDR